MNTYKVLTVELTNEMIEAINTHGWGNAMQEMPSVKTFLEVTTKGSASFTEDMTEHYRNAGYIEAEDLEDAFIRSNEGVSGNKSLSVGDILIDEDGQKHFVDIIGFATV